MIGSYDPKLFIFIFSLFDYRPRLIKILYEKAIIIANMLNEFILDSCSRERVIQLMDTNFNYQGFTYNERRERIIADIPQMETIGLIYQKEGMYKINRRLLKVLVISSLARV